MDPIFILRWKGYVEIPTLLGAFVGLLLGTGCEITFPKDHQCRDLFIFFPPVDGKRQSELLQFLI
jgi:hypothetical protein